MNNEDYAGFREMTLEHCNKLITREMVNDEHIVIIVSEV